MNTDTSTDAADGVIIRAQRQRWPRVDRILITALSRTADLLGSVQLELYPEEQPRIRDAAYLYALWVGPDYRRAGVATALMRAAETLAGNAGHKSITLEWDIKEAPVEICRWYGRLGYQEREFTPGKSALMRKEL